MADMSAICEGGRSLETTAIKKYPTKKTQPIDTNKHPHNFLSSHEAIGEDLQEQKPHRRHSRGAGSV
ncbi:hypothetical protein SESBI_18106 [Sesbania bispinosa]|nr:hypothetical protein SESBI_18106 [Sesbania bispinosa]